MDTRDLRPEERNHIHNAPLYEALRDAIYDLRTSLAGAISAEELLEQIPSESNETAEMLFSMIKGNHAEMIDLINQIIGGLLPRLHSELTDSSHHQENHIADYYKYDLCQKVARAISVEPKGTVVCALENGYTPHGSWGEVWVALSAQGGIISRFHAPYFRGRGIYSTRQVDENEASTIHTQLNRLHIWELSDFEPIFEVFDGQYCTIAVGEGERLHSFKMHNPEGQHKQLIEYLLELAPLQQE
jgi:hypothetical protein